MSDQAQTIARLGVEAVPSRERRPKPALHAVEPAPVAAPQPALPRPQEPPPAAEPIIITRPPNAHDLILANLKTIALILATRVLLLLTIIGAFVLALGAMQWQSPMGLAVLCAWCALTVLPMTWLEFAGRFRNAGR